MSGATRNGVASTTRRATRAPKAFYPATLDSVHPKFWLAAFLRDCAELEALTAHYESAGRKADWLTTPLVNALSEATWKKRDETVKSAIYTKDDGLLPYAWQGTRALEMSE